jgi:crossover junction endodeoxyribonuclease RusA
VIVLRLPYPISANRYWRTTVLTIKGVSRVQTYVSPEAKAFKEHIAWIAKQAGIRAPIVGRVEIGYRLYPKRPQDYELRMRQQGELWDDSVQCVDLGNAEKIMSDALQDIVIGNDSLVRRLVGERMEPDEEGARLMLYVRPIPTRQALIA